LTAVRFALFLVVKKQNFKPFLKEKQSGNHGLVQSDADSAFADADADAVLLHLRVTEI